MRKISDNLGSIYSSLELRLNKFEASITKGIEGFYKLQTNTQKASSIMDKSIYTAVNNIDKSYRLWESANERTGRSIFDNSKKVDAYKSQIKLLDDEIKKSEKILEDITKRFGENSKEAEEYRGHVLDLKVSHSQLTEEMRKAVKETGTFSGRMELLGKEFEKIDDKFKGFDKVGDKFQSVGNKLTLGLTFPIVGAGVAATKFAFDFEKGGAMVATIADTTKISIDKLKEGVINLSNETAMSTTDLNNALYQSISAGVDTANSIEFLGTAVKTAKAGFADTETAVDALTTVLNAYGMKATEVTKISDQMMEAQNFGKTTFAEMGSSIGNVIPIAASLNVSTKELLSSLAVLTKNGIKTSEAVTGLKAAYSNILKPSDEAGELAEKLGIKFSAAHLKSVGWAKFLDEVRTKTKGNAESMATLFGSVEALNSVMVLTGKGASDFALELKRMDNVTGLTDESFKKVTDTTEAKFSMALNKAKNSAMELGVKLLPIVEKGINLFSDLTDKFNKLSPSTQEWIIKVGLATAVLGPFLNVTGGAVKGIGALLKLGPKVGTFFGLFNGATAAASATSAVGTAATVATGTAAGGGILGLGASIGGLAVAAAPWLLAGVAVAGTGYLIYKGLTDETIPAVDLFADKVEVTSEVVRDSTGTMATAYDTAVTKISEGTKKAVGDYVELDNKAKEHMNNLYINSTIITDQIKVDTVAKFGEMKNQVVAGFEAQKNESITKLQEMFVDARTISSTEQKELLNSTTEFYSSKVLTTQNYEQQINGIISRASAEKRAITDDEMKTITSLQNQMRENAVNALSQNEIEAKIILDRMSQYDKRITAEQASTHIKQLNESRDKAVQTARDEYEKRVALIERLKSEGVIKSQEQADRMIAEARRQRDGIVDNAEQTRLDAISKMRDMNSDLDNQVNTSTGEILSAWERLKRWWNGWKPETKSFSYNLKQEKRTHQMSPQWEQNASGTDYFKGGLTTLHERGYEVYDLPEGTRIYNHEASEDLAVKTAEAVARNVVRGLKIDSRPINNGPSEVVVPVILDGREIARVTAPYMGEELEFQRRRRNIGSTGGVW